MSVELKTMELKKTQLSSGLSPDVKDSKTANQLTRSFKIGAFLEDVKAELKKISWTTQAELKTYTRIVIAATFCFGMGVYITDLMIQFVLGTLESAIRMIGG